MSQQIWSPKEVEALVEYIDFVAETAGDKSLMLPENLLEARHNRIQFGENKHKEYQKLKSSLFEFVNENDLQEDVSIKISEAKIQDKVREHKNIGYIDIIVILCTYV